jgi:hypothetical protein
MSDLRHEDELALARWKAERKLARQISRQYEHFRRNALAYGQNDLAQRYRKMSTLVSQFLSVFIEFAVSFSGSLIQEVVGNVGGCGCRRTKRSGWAA